MVTFKSIKLDNHHIKIWSQLCPSSDLFFRGYTGNQVDHTRHKSTPIHNLNPLDISPSFSPILGKAS